MSLLLLQWVGGKGHQLDALLRLIPYRRTYVEPFGGGASILLSRQPSEVEVYNDLNWDVVNFFSIIRDPMLGEELTEMCYWTPYAHEEFRGAIDVLTKIGVDSKRVNDVCRLERARALFTRQNQGISGVPITSPASWSRSMKDSSNTMRWNERRDRFGQVRDRLADVQITNEDALACIERWDAPDTVFYCDPPYVLDTRGGQFYQNEYADADHERLVERLHDVKGCVVLSGYDHPIYEPLVGAGWERLEYEATAMSVVTDGHKPKRREVVWRNPQARDQTTLF